METGDTRFSELEMMAWVRDLYVLSQAGTAERDGESVAGGILDLMIQGFRADGGYLALPDESSEGGGVLRVAAVRDMPGLSLAVSLDLNAGMLLGGSESAGAAPSETGADALRDWGEGGIFLPLIAGERIVGALRLHRHPDKPYFDADDWERGSIMVGLAALILDNRRLQAEQGRRIAELSRVNKLLETAHNQLLQSEKMASIGQLAAGVAHEINNPIGFVHSNLGSLGEYITDVFRVLDAYEAAEVASGHPDAFAEVRRLRRQLDVDFLREDAQALLGETKGGVVRVKKIVQDLKNFSHPGQEGGWDWEDLHRCLDGTLNIVANEIKYKATVVKHYGEIPPVPCDPTQISQVFLNLLVNAAHAMDSQGTITLSTWHDADWATVEVADTGGGIKPENLGRIFDPFFTTKPVGKGTGLGLSLSYGIVQKHGGRIEVDSLPGVGSRFRVILPLKRQEGEAGADTVE